VLGDTASVVRDSLDEVEVGITAEPEAVDGDLRLSVSLLDIISDLDAGRLALRCLTIGEKHENALQISRQVFVSRDNRGSSETFQQSIVNVSSSISC